ncbi:3-keto-5-aminohexanoate cleavage protein [Amnibacterium endophyticum]|uniref:3-keto-5-aminohexanoate cleavage protein n=1 Tax=Amnibacterium endophyticum TaxID=2109337 RepID=A0ABW4LD11_9MICO
MLQAALNGRRSKRDHEGVPVTAAELQRDAIECAAEGAHGFHVHPRDELGVERMDAAVVDAAATALHDATRWPVSVSTADWIEVDLRARQAAVARWRGPDSATVEVKEEDSFDLIRTLLGLGIEVEAGLQDAEDAAALVRSGLGDRVHRLLIELVHVPAAEVVDRAAEVHRVLDHADLLPPRLQHGEDDSAWIALEDAVRRGVDTRIGLEDALLLPDGSRAASNAALIRAAVSLGAA